MFILNINYRPTLKSLDIKTTINDAIKIGRNRPLLILGDFNVVHPNWGYHARNHRGSLLSNNIDDLNLLLLNHPDSPTRPWTRVTRDTTPDLSFPLGSLDVTCFLTKENLRFHHDVILLTIKNQNCTAQMGVARLTNWDAF